MTGTKICVSFVQFQDEFEKPTKEPGELSNRFGSWQFVYSLQIFIRHALVNATSQSRTDDLAFAGQMLYLWANVYKDTEPRLHKWKSGIEQTTVLMTKKLNLFKSLDEPRRTFSVCHLNSGVHNIGCSPR